MGLVLFHLFFSAELKQVLSSTVRGLGVLDEHLPWLDSISAALQAALELLQRSVETLSNQAYALLGVHTDAVRQVVSMKRGRLYDQVARSATRPLCHWPNSVWGQQA